MPGAISANRKEVGTFFQPNDLDVLRCFKNRFFWGDSMMWAEVLVVEHRRLLHGTDHWTVLEPALAQMVRDRGKNQVANVQDSNCPIGSMHGVFTNIDP